MTTQIMKFGGSCFVDAAAFGKIQKITELYKKDRKIYVASALNGITDTLVEISKRANNLDAHGVLDLIKIIEKKHLDTISIIFGETLELKQKAIHFIQEKLSELQQVLEEISEFGLEPYFSDYVLSFGEKLSTFLLHLYLVKCGYSSQFFTGEELIITDDNYTDALPDLKFTFKRIHDKIVPLLEDASDDTIFVVTGFIGRNKVGYTTTLGRGGSDFTATIMARAIFETCNDKNVKVILWKDVGGILTANPKLVKHPTLIRRISYKESKELAYFGAKILHPKCLSVIENQKIDVEIKNFSNPEEHINYSVISDESDVCELKGIGIIEKAAMVSVASASLVNVPGVLGKIFTLLGENGISVSMIAQSSSEINTTFVVELAEGPRAVEIMKKDPFFQNWFTIEQEPVGIIAVIGCQIHVSEHKFKIFNALKKINVSVLAIAQSSDGINVSLLVPCDRVKEVANAINEEFQAKNVCETN